VQSYRERAWRDAREWFSPKDLLWALLPAVVALAYFRIAGETGAVHDALVAVVVAAISAALIVIGSLLFFAIRAPFKIFGEELASLRADIDELKKPEPTDLALGRLRDLYAQAELLRKRGPNLRGNDAESGDPDATPSPWPSAPTGFEDDLAAWITEVSEALADHPSFQREFMADAAVNPLAAALLDPLASLLTQKMGLLEVIIKRLGES
jgi:hypothetical protein